MRHFLEHNAERAQAGSRKAVDLTVRLSLTVRFTAHRPERNRGTVPSDSRRKVCATWHRQGDRRPGKLLTMGSKSASLATWSVRESAKKAERVDGYGVPRASARLRLGGCRPERGAARVSLARQAPKAESRKKGCYLNERSQ